MAIHDDDEYRQWRGEVNAALRAVARRVARDVIYGKWQIGAVLSRYPRKYGERTIATLAADLQKSPSDLWDCLRLFRQYPIEDAFWEFYTALENSLPLPPAWRRIRQEHLHGRSEEGRRIDSQRQRLDRIQRNLEKEEEKLGELKEQVSDRGILGEVDSLRFKAQENIEDAERLEGQIEENEPDPELWWDYLREAEGCVVCGDTEIEIVHFPRSKGAGASDFDTLPLCRAHHAEQHNYRYS